MDNSVCEVFVCLLVSLPTLSLSVCLCLCGMCVFHLHVFYIQKLHCILPREPENIFLREGLKQPVINIHMALLNKVYPQKKIIKI